ncbi:unnamed protein product [Ectocarpus sp. 12 AP-2014]
MWVPTSKCTNRHTRRWANLSKPQSSLHCVAVKDIAIIDKIREASASPPPVFFVAKTLTDQGTTMWLSKKCQNHQKLCGVYVAGGKHERTRLRTSNAFPGQDKGETCMANIISTHIHPGLMSEPSPPPPGPLCETAHFLRRLRPSTCMPPKDFQDGETAAAPCQNPLHGRIKTNQTTSPCSSNIATTTRRPTGRDDHPSSPPAS